MAVYDFGLSSAEFGRMTPGMFSALAERKTYRFRKESYLAGLVASTVWNSAPRGKDSTPASPYDWVPVPVAEAEREEIKSNIRSFFAMVDIRSAEQAQKMRDTVIQGLKADGCADAEEIFAEVFPAWAQKHAGQSQTRA